MQDFTAENAEKRRAITAGYNEIGEKIIGAAIRVHSALGPGLLEGVYEICLCHELTKAGLRIQRHVPLPVSYDGVSLEIGYRLDILVADTVVVEIKAVESVIPLHLAQLLGYLKLGKFKLGYLLNFNVVKLRDGIRRLVNDL